MLPNILVKTAYNVHDSEMKSMAILVAWSLLYAADCGR